MIAHKVLSSATSLGTLVLSLGSRWRDREPGREGARQIGVGRGGVEEYCNNRVPTGAIGVVAARIARPQGALR